MRKINKIDAPPEMQKRIGDFEVLEFEHSPKTAARSAEARKQYAAGKFKARQQLRR